MGWPAGKAGALGCESLNPAQTVPEIQLGGIAQLEVAKGDILIVETPGGGGFGKLYMPGHPGPI